MTIDERLEALTQSVELMASLQKDHENQTRAAFAEAAARSTEASVGIAETVRLIIQLVSSKTHEQRLDKIEHRQ